MLTQKPKQVDFDKLSKIMDGQAKNMMSVILNLEKDIKILEDKEEKPGLTDEEKEMLELFRYDLAENKIAYEVKANAYQRYLVRVEEQKIRQQQELKDFVENAKKVFEKATIYSRNYRLPQNLRDHLNEILKQNIMFVNNIPLPARVDYYLALKKEVEICSNYLKK